MMRGQEDARNDRPSGIPAVQEAYGLVEQQFTELQKPLSEAKVVALEQAVDCSRWMDLHDHEDPVGQVLAVAGRFEAYLTGKEAP
jgi:hypothetical protein